MRRRPILIGMLLTLALPAAAAAQGPTETSLAGFFPAPVAGLSDQPPAWETPRFPGQSLWGSESPRCTWQTATGEGMEPPVETCPGHVTSSVSRQYFVPDSALERQVRELDQRIQGPRAHMMELMGQGKMPSQAEIAEINGLTRTQDSLKALARHVALEIQSNVTPTQDESPAGSVAGHPQYRRPWPVGRDLVGLSVFVAPAGFSAPAPDGQHHAEIRCLYVTAVVAQRDAALAQALLEKVDYAGLAQLIRP
jgi:hypothetical protein